MPINMGMFEMPLNMSRLTPYLQLMRLNRPIGSTLLLWPTLWAVWLAADGKPDGMIVLIFIVGTIVMRSAGCVINDWADRHIDHKVSRTKMRPLSTGKLNSKQAFILFFALMLLALIVVIPLNWLAIKISFAAAGIAVLYPFTKRFTHFPQGFLGIAFSMGIPIAYAAIVGNIPNQAWVLFAANFFWIVAYDTQYAMSDRPDDIKAGIRSTAILFGQYDHLIVGLLQLLFIAIMALVGMLNQLGFIYYAGLIMACGFLIYQQWLCKDRIPAGCLKAFLNNNWVGGVIYFAMLIDLSSGNIFS